MNRVSPQIRSLAKRLRASETGEILPSVPSGRAVFRTVETLRAYLAMLMGRSGCEALLARALVLAVPEVPWLSAVRVIADGELEGLPEAYAKSDAPEFANGEVAVLAQILGLLVAFIGPALTLRLLKQLWPDLSFSEVDFSNTSNDEDANSDG